MSIIKKVLDIAANPSRHKKSLTVLSGSLIISGWAAYFLIGSVQFFNSLMIVSTLVAGMEIGKRAWQGLKNSHTNIELLVKIAAVGGLAIGVYWEAAAVTFLFLLGGWLEARTMSKTRSTLRELINMAPDTAIVLDDDGQREIPARQVAEGMLVLVKPGSKIPVDGTVESGSSSVDESAITGEAIPVEKEADSEVYAGTINKNGSLKIRAQKAGADTTLAKIIKRVEEAQEEKAPTQRFIERFAKWYTPFIIGLSITSFLVTWNLELALTLLVIGCPGALVISTPISIISGIGNAAKKGILIKGGEYLENAGKIDTVVFDKTGTITEGEPRVTDIISFHEDSVPAGYKSNRKESGGISWLGLENVNQKELSGPYRDILYWAGIAESVSEHPLAEAILFEAIKLTKIPEPDYFQSHTGMGIEAMFEDSRILVGKRQFLDEMGVTLDDKVQMALKDLTQKGRTGVLVARDGVLLGAIGIADRMRDKAPEMVKQLRNAGVERLIMLTGDSHQTAKAIANELDLDEFKAELLPDEKNEYINKVKADGKQVAMIGDGINDAPALANADIGIAMGAAGTDVAIETADIALMADNLMNVPEALSISISTLRNIHQNVAIALITVAALLTGVFMGSVHMAAGMLIHELSVMLVILNGMRLRWI